MISVDDPAIPAPAGASESVDSSMPISGREKFHQVSQQRQLVAARAAQLFQRRERLLAAQVARAQDNAPVCPRLHHATGVAIDGEIHRDRAGMIQIQRPDIDSAAGHIDAARRLGAYSHAEHSNITQGPLSA